MPARFTVNVGSTQAVPWWPSSPPTCTGGLHRPPVDDALVAGHVDAVAAAAIANVQRCEAVQRRGVGVAEAAGTVLANWASETGVELVVNSASCGHSDQAGPTTSTVANDGE